MSALFENLGHWVESGGGLAVLASFVWGLLSVALSPCSLASISVLIGFLSGEGCHTRTRSFALSLLFAAGMLVSLVAVGLVTAALGRLLGDTGPWLTYVVAGILLLFAADLWGYSIIPWSTPDVARWGWRGPAAAVGLGALLGIALGPCTFSFAAPVLGAVFTAAPAHLVAALVFMAAFAAGHCLVIAVAGAFAATAQRWADTAAASGWPQKLRRVCAVLIVLGAGWLAWGAG